jgi:probable HAF family extracellular repeat protein
MRRIAMVLTFALGCLSSSAQPKYVVNNLGLAGGATTSTSALGINNAGQVTGNSNVGPGVSSRAWRTAPNSAIDPATDLIPLPPGGVTSGLLWNSINSFGQVTLFVVSDSGVQHAFRLDTDGSINDLKTLGGTGNTSRGFAINDSGQVAGDSTTSFLLACSGIGGRNAFRTTPNSQIAATDGLGTLLNPPCRSSFAFGMNNAGDVVGSSSANPFASPQTHAFIAIGNVMTDLGVLGVSPGATDAQITSTASAINNSGQIVGSSTFNHPASVPFNAVHAFLTTATRPMQDLGTLGGNSSSATGINASGQIVGRSTTTGEVATHGFLYSGGIMYDLNNLVTSSSMEINVVFSINDLGQIVGTAGGMDGTGIAVRLDPSDVAISILGTQVINLGLPNGTQTSLLSKLRHAIAAIQISDYSTALGDLGAFINAVNAQTGKKISPADAAALIAAANSILSAL